MSLLVGSGLPLAGGILGAGGEGDLGRSRCGRATSSPSSGEIEEITPSRSRPERGMVKVRSETRNQRGEVVQIMLARLVVPRRIGSASAG